MGEILTSKLSPKGQVVIPVSIRKSLNLHSGTKLAFEVKDNTIRIRKLPTEKDWAELIKKFPVENVEIDKSGHYDPKQSPDFHDWMVNG